MPTAILLQGENLARHAGSDKNDLAKKIKKARIQTPSGQGVRVARLDRAMTKLIREEPKSDVDSIDSRADLIKSRWETGTSRGEIVKSGVESIDSRADLVKSASHFDH
jgi:hypothetical protein